MKLAATLVSLFITATAAMPASAAMATPLSPSRGEVAAVIPIKAVQHRQTHHRAPADRDDAYAAYGYGGVPQLYNWSHWSRSHHPGWPCVAGMRSDDSVWSAYPSWEIRPYCQ